MISKDESTVGDSTKVLHNAYFFEWKYQNVFLRYFTTKSKTKETLVSHWKQTILDWNLKNISAFVSDMALSYVPNSLKITHAVCGVHMLDLSVENHYNPTFGKGIQGEIKKFIAIRQYLTQTVSVEKLKKNILKLK